MYLVSEIEINSSVLIIAIKFNLYFWINIFFNILEENLFLS